MNKVFKIKRNDTFPALSLSIKSRGCVGEVIPFNLSGVTSCKFTMTDIYGNPKVFSAPAQITSVSGGTILYQWAEGDTNDDGKFNGEFELYFGGANKMTVPVLGNIEIYILPDLNNI
jgi:hypothetical protein